jgi:hypothetical protein
MTEEEIEQIRTAGILHDVGKVGVADAVLLKPAHLTEDEFLEMQRHSALGRDIVQGAGMPNRRAGIAAVSGAANCIEKRDSGCGFSGVSSRPVYGSFLRGLPSIRARRYAAYAASSMSLYA